MHGDFLYILAPIKCLRSVFVLHVQCNHSSKHGVKFYYGSVVHTVYTVSRRSKLFIAAPYIPCPMFVAVQEPEITVGKRSIVAKPRPTN